MDELDEMDIMDNSGYILRSYREVWKEQLRAASAPDEVTRLQEMKIGAAMGVYVITGKRHDEAAEYMQEQLEDGLTLAEKIALQQFVEDEFQVAVSIDYGPDGPKICRN